MPANKARLRIQERGSGFTAPLSCQQRGKSRGWCGDRQLDEAAAKAPHCGECGVAVEMALAWSLEKMEGF